MNAKRMMWSGFIWLLLSAPSASAEQFTCTWEVQQVNPKAHEEQGIYKITIDGKRATMKGDQGTDRFTVAQDDDSDIYLVQIKNLSFDNDQGKRIRQFMINGIFIDKATLRSTSTFVMHPYDNSQPFAVNAESGHCVR